MVVIGRNTEGLHEAVAPKHRLRLVMLIATTATSCSGCWQEVRYNPDKSSPVSQQKPQETLPETPTEEKSPSADELFTDDAALSEEPETSQTESVEPGPDNHLTELLAQDSDGPATTVPAPPAELDWIDDAAKEELATTETSIIDEPTELTQTARAAWKMGSKWSLAAAYFSKGLGPERYGASLAEAETAAQVLGVPLPALPENIEEARLQIATVDYLLGEAGPRLIDHVRELHPINRAALVELAVKSHALLLVYTPQNKNLEPLVTDIRRAAENSGLSEDVWIELIGLLEQRANFTSVKSAVFQLHEQATAYVDDPDAE